MASLLSLTVGMNAMWRKPPTLSQEKSQEKQNWNVHGPEAQLQDMLTHVLAIPMDEALPTPNACKACVLSIWLLQVQCLAVKFLLPVWDRIAFALCCGMTSELGKEGEKGSACDGLKVSRTSHDLSLYQPSTFTPALVKLLPSILSNLLVPILILQTQACHALGGCYVLDNIDFLPSTYNTLRSKPLIVHTLCSMLSTTDPTHVAHGPMWVLSVLASFIVLLGPKVCADIKLTCINKIMIGWAIELVKSMIQKGSQDWVFDKLIELWKITLHCLWMTEKYDLPFGIMGLMKANMAFLLDVGGHDGAISFGACAANLLADILQNEEALTEQQMEPYECTPEKDCIIPPAAAFIHSSVAFPSLTENDLEDELAIKASLITPVVVPPLTNMTVGLQPELPSPDGDLHMGQVFP
ncbi:hypothetical protein EDC04DRAFT_2616176 [Pisolithus marmoratus]|nr:hypothetical protein EDC04DRAFT_2616176 [Pisolithus marmoratus]